MSDFEHSAALVKALAGVAAILKDPKGWDDRAQKVLDAAKQAAADLGDAQDALAAAKAEREATAKDLETIKAERAQADRSYQNAREQADSIRLREAKVAEREQKVTTAEERLAADSQRVLAEQTARGAEIDAKHQEAEEKLARAQALMADYDEAKHKAALQLAS